MERGAGKSVPGGRGPARRGRARALRGFAAAALAAVAAGGGPRRGRWRPAAAAATACGRLRAGVRVGVRVVPGRGWFSLERTRPAAWHGVVWQNPKGQKKDWGPVSLTAGGLTSVVAQIAQMAHCFQTRVRSQPKKIDAWSEWSGSRVPLFQGHQRGQTRRCVEARPRCASVAPWPILAPRPSPPPLGHLWRHPPMTQTQRPGTPVLSRLLCGPDGGGGALPFV